MTASPYPYHELPCSSQQVVDGRPSPAKAQMRRRPYPDPAEPEPRSEYNRQRPERRGGTR